MPGRITIITFLIIIEITVSVSGQIKTAKREMSLFNYSQAIELLQKDVMSENMDVKHEATLLMAECYRKQNDVVNAKAWYGRSMGFKGNEPMTIYYFAQALRSAGNYPEAKNMFLKYDSAVPGDPRGKIYAGHCENAMAWQGRIPLFEIENMTALNTPESEFGTVFYHHGIIFASDRVLSKQEVKTYGWTGNNYLRLFLAEPTDPGGMNRGFLTPEPFKDLKEQSGHNGPASFNLDNTEIFINRTLFNRDKGKKENDRIRTHLLKIFTASIIDEKWSKPEPFFLNNDEFSVGHPSLSPDGNRLCFVSDMPGGSGGTDIYICTRDAGKWSAPVNLGDEVNTFGNEMFPFFANSGDLYFASDGLPGFGGFDLFVTRKVYGKWTTPENLGQPINSSYDDFSLATADTGKTGLFSSNRPGGSGNDDIYSFTSIPPTPPPLMLPPPFISGCVKDKSTLDPIPGSTVFIFDEDMDQVLILKTNEKGCFKTPIVKGRSYKVKATKTTYLPDCLSFIIDSLNKNIDLALPRVLLLDKVEINKKFTLENIFYDFDKSNIRPDAESSLNNLVRILNENPVRVELGSHTDCRGSEEYNRILSQKRAESAVLYIVNQGIDSARITAKGYGKSQLINRCNCTAGIECTEAEHQVNRRTEFRIIGFSDQKLNSPVEQNLYKSGEIRKAGTLPDGFFEGCDLE